MAPAKKGPKPFESGLSRVDNRLKFTSFIQVPPINQKNYYTEYLKRDDQAIIVRQLAEDLARAKEQKAQKDPEATVDEMDMDEKDEDEQEAAGSKVIVIHPGSRNLRIGLASWTFPKSVPAVVAYRVGDDEAAADEAARTYDLAAAAESAQFGAVKAQMTADFKERMRFYKRRVAANSQDSVIAFNRRAAPEEIPDHNDPYRVEWTDVSGAPKHIVGERALHIPPASQPRYRLCWPLQHGCFNEADYASSRQLMGDLYVLLSEAIETELQVPRRELGAYSAVLMIPDLYDKVEVSEMVNMMFRELGFEKVCIIQESMGATFGAGISSACVVDIGAQKTAVCCVEEGMCLTDSRVNLKYGGDDVTLLLGKLLAQAAFPYEELNPRVQYDWALLEELKAKYATVNDADIAVQLYNFYQRTPGRLTQKYTFKIFNEVMLAPMGYFFPDVFENAGKLRARNTLFEKSTDLYDLSLNNPYSEAQVALYAQYTPSPDPGLLHTTPAATAPPSGLSTPRPAGRAGALSQSHEDTPTAETPADGPAQPAANSSSNNTASRNLSTQAATLSLMDSRQVVAAPLDQAIIESITQASATDETRAKRMYENIIIVGGGANFPAFTHMLEDRVAMWKGWSSGSVTVMPTPREMDPTLLVWKGGAVFVKLKIATEMWIGRREWDLLGARCLQYKSLFLY
ncbi:uncharacterized protein V1510DRAFT_237530 [Dipodascopsis tothii]|uniref:uncharacterized protein n=1 Tax=Dipodascopsis tothii TaxID=44089 RepID=UPI0034CF0185